MDFFYRGMRCREQTALKDTTENRRRVQTLANRTQKEIEQGTFSYAQHFPNSPKAAQLAESGAISPALAPARAQTSPSVAPERQTPRFAEFAELWFLEMSPQWRRLRRQGVREVLDKNLLPTFGDRPLQQISKADVLGFRAELAQLPGRKGDCLGAARINKIMCFLRQVLNEAADRFEFTPAFRSIKPLKQKRTDVQTFSLDEVQKILATVRPDYRDYLTVRFFTGLPDAGRWREPRVDRADHGSLDDRHVVQGLLAFRAQPDPPRRTGLRRPGAQPGTRGAPCPSPIPSAQTSSEVTARSWNIVTLTLTTSWSATTKTLSYRSENFSGTICARSPVW